MNNEKSAITSEEHDLYMKTVALHERNITLNHEEDERPILDIISEGLNKLPEIILG